MPNKHEQTSWGLWGWHVLLMCVFVAVFLGRFAWPPLQVEALGDLKIADKEVGYLFMVSFYLGYLLTQLPGGLLSDHFGAKVVLAASLLISGICTLAFSSITTAYTGYAWRFLAGIGGGAVYSACIRATVSRFPKEKMGKAMGFLMMAPTLGTLVPNLLAPRLANWLGGWRPGFLSIGLFLVALAVLFYVCFPKSEKTASAGAAKISPLAGLKFVWGEKRLRLLAVTGFCLLWTYIGFVSAGNSYMMEVLAYDKLKAGNVMAVFSLVGLASTFLGGALMDKIKLRELVLILSFAFMVVASFIFTKVTTDGAILTVAALMGLGVGAGNSISAVLTAEYAGPKFAGAAGGATGFLFQTAAMISPWVLGRSIKLSASYDYIGLILGLAPLVGIVLLILLTKIRLKMPPA